jgi:uncharacterized membrane protein
MYGNYGGAIFLMAVGAILKWAVNGSVSGLSISTVGIILLLAGLAWLILAIAFDLSARRRGPVVERERVVDPEPRVW